jgi:hypothetical protein
MYLLCLLAATAPPTSGTGFHSQEIEGYPKHTNQADWGHGYAPIGDVTATLAERKTSCSSRSRWTSGWVQSKLKIRSEHHPY